MKFSEAMRLLEEGQRVFCPVFSKIPFDKTGAGFSESLGAAILKGCWCSEWELYKEPEKLLSFQDVVKGLKLRKKFKMAHWNNCFLQLSILGNLVIYSDSGREERWTPDLEDLESCDWCEVK